MTREDADALAGKMNAEVETGARPPARYVALETLAPRRGVVLFGGWYVRREKA